MRNELTFRLKRKFNRRSRLATAFVGSILILGALLFCLPTIAPSYFFTLDDRFSLLTPRGFQLGQHYDFNFAQVSNNTKELALPRPDNHMIIFKYPEVVQLGRPTYLGSEITQSVDFTVKDPPANGLIQIWVLNTSLEDFLRASREFSTVDYLTFETENKKKDALSYTLWNYTFKSNDKIIRGLEAFFDDKPYMYRISVFVDNKNYNEKFQALFDEMVQSVTVH